VKVKQSTDVEEVEKEKSRNRRNQKLYVKDEH
jgi:hypothetical protein